MKIKMFAVLLFLVFGTFAFAEKDEILMVPIGRIPKGVEQRSADFRPYSVQAVPNVYLMTLGMDDVIQPRATFSMTTTFDEYYRKGSPVYLFAIVCNFDSISQRLKVQYKLTGGKTLNINQNKAFQGRTIYALFVKKPLGPNPALYQMQVTLFQGPNVVVDTLISRFIVNSTY